MEKHLSHIHTRWRRLIVSLYLSCLIFIGRVYKRRSNIHWVGRHPRRKRYDRLLIVSLFLGAMVLLNAREYAYWCTVAGGTTAIFLNLYTVYRFIPRKRGHWI